MPLNWSGYFSRSAEIAARRGKTVEELTHVPGPAVLDVALVDGHDHAPLLADGDEHLRLRKDLVQTVAELGGEIMLRNAVPRGAEPLGELPPEGRQMIERQGAKRVGLEFIERRRASWDHRRLGGVY